ncbi:hypothetical protein ECTPHS_09453 [Ectothiorhodospira sp. PHS-1]|uniref:hypothetical protein n=1 Tax=Ectothiorhodospira sp. PHS-1 TaxID=519989 RepID=UPI00024A8706|nr:hypothetical protein [Ectothiorhodospira sp. PHS-1]EHQ52907.1 hypothetical protein ECTPHS_09453 [Ectothiorhodospira sp. PHS-1]
MAKRKRGNGGEAHVRLYRHELNSPAWQTLSMEARVLLVEMRSLFSGRENRVHMSIREIQHRLGIGRFKAVKARDELLDRGWIRVIEKGTFARKTKAATVFALENEPIHDCDGATAPKTFLRWRPDPCLEKKSRCR